MIDWLIYNIYVNIHLLFILNFHVEILIEIKIPYYCIIIILFHYMSLCLCRFRRFHLKITTQPFCQCVCLEERREVKRVPALLGGSPVWETSHLWPTLTRRLEHRTISQSSDSRWEASLPICVNILPHTFNQLFVLLHVLMLTSIDMSD